MPGFLTLIGPNGSINWSTKPFSPAVTDEEHYLSLFVAMDDAGLTGLPLSVGAHASIFLKRAYHSYRNPGKRTKLMIKSFDYQIDATLASHWVKQR